ncbi:MAG: PAS domain S-box protein, partial [Proteobacteria bacterium]|nr:PAS domain S-box protein [Pseudomonadota bacterium]
MELLSEQIENIITQNFKLVQALSKDHAVLDLLEGREDPSSLRITQVLETARLISYADRIYVINRNGIIVSSTKTIGISIIGDNYAFRPYFEDAWKGRTTVFPALGDKSNSMELHFSTPIYGSSKESVDGVLALEFDILVVEDLLYQRVEQIGLVSPEGIIFNSNNPEWIFHSVKQITENTLERLIKIKQFGGEKILPLNLDITKKLVQIKGKDYYTAIVSMPISGWKIISLQKKDLQLALPLFYKYLVGTGLCVTGGLVLLVFFLMMNIQKQKKIQSELSQTQEKYSSIFRNAVMGIYQSTIDGRFIDVNPSMANILGFESSLELMSTINNIDYQIYVHSSDRQKFINKVLKDKQIEGFETRFFKKDGGIISVQLSGRLAWAVEDDDPFLEGFCVDITEKIVAQEKAALRQQQLLVADRMISMGVLASGVAHEINNPNTLIHSNAQFLSDAWTEAQIIMDEYYNENGDFIISGLPYSKVKEKLPVINCRILEGSRRIARIIKELRDYSRNDDSEVREQIDVNKVIKSVLILLENMIKKATQNFILDLKEDIPPVMGSFQRLEQVIVNIVQNSCQAIVDEKKALYVLSFFNKSDKKVVIICKDEGIGIPKENLKRIVDPFFTTKRDSGGTGLGLSISSTIVQELGGSLNIQSENGSGTIVRLEFPPVKIKNK